VGGSSPPPFSQWGNAPLGHHSVVSRCLALGVPRPVPLLVHHCRPIFPLRPVLFRTFSLEGDRTLSRQSKVHSQHFTVPKPSVGARLILDLPPLNLFLKPVGLPTPLYRTIEGSATQASLAGQGRPQSAYWHVPIDPAFRSYRTFRWHNRMVQFRAIPVGLSTAPAAFTGLVLPVYLTQERECRVSFTWTSGLLGICSEECPWVPPTVPSCPDIAGIYYQRGPRPQQSPLLIRGRDRRSFLKLTASLSAVEDIIWRSPRGFLQD
jgi:hypothetical protein